MLEVCSGVTNEKEEDGGYKRSSRTLGQRDQERWELRYMLSDRACARGLNLVVLLLCASELDRSNESGMTWMNLNESPYWERADPLL